MINFYENQMFEAYNVISHRSILSNEEATIAEKRMNAWIYRSGRKKVLPTITTTYSIFENGSADIELLMSVDEEMNMIEGYSWKPIIRIQNALMLHYKGPENGLNDCMSSANKYMMERGFVPITNGYNIARHDDTQMTNDVELTMYIGISPNIL